MDEIEEDPGEMSPEAARQRTEAKNAGPSTVRRRVLRFTESQGQKTLEKPEKVSNPAIDTESLIDPLFKQTTRKFDELSGANMLAGNLQITNHLQLQLDSRL